MLGPSAGEKCGLGKKAVRRVDQKARLLPPPKPVPFGIEVYVAIEIVHRLPSALDMRFQCLMRVEVGDAQIRGQLFEFPVRAIGLVRRFQSLPCPHDTDGSAEPRSALP